MTSKPKYPVLTIDDIDLNNDKLVDMETITKFTGMTDKWFYKLISLDQFPKPIKCGRSSRWLERHVKEWVLERIEASRS
ncbi:MULTISPECIES: helix-turn-helix transcriptional regulator [Tenebrionibacter/Tenebrionicola group]|jgi:prophage regulatory protein|uniref:AlpA family phage regulatory protein n=2 Tax=Tenebrionibacter/Tenebrionicola group TaxID=2969848 RepID=A0A8K0V8S5_9ENTR|nr:MULTISPECIES: AlpA family phage regulatory protein [Tenebrionibacter/Tenebrionicola group]MBK4717125.1 AlpA family phage regulatory protein [Tenebrionibacter intestinalis]MBV5097468.1 AlpA family phage regulatory protein [Tenebrionicola larvae]